MRRLAFLAAAALVALPSAQARPDAPAAEPGVSPTTVLLGGTFPLSGRARGRIRAMLRA